MSLNATPSSDRIHIGIFGKRNAGKSSIINAITGQNLAIVSEVKGTTTDPVLKSMELLPLGPVVIIDTPGLDDEGTLGNLRIQKACQMLNKTDIAVLVTDAAAGMTKEDCHILERIQKKELPYIIVFNKADLAETDPANKVPSAADHKNIPDAAADAPVQTSSIPHFISPKKCIRVSAKTGMGIHELKEMIAAQVPAYNTKKSIVGDLISARDFVVLVVPIDSAAPKGRLILPQQQTIRDILETGAASIVVRETELADTLHRLGEKPSLVITDSQAFKKVSAIVPADIPLTSFSILFARYKGNLANVVQGAYALDHLKDGDTLLISEGCTHHRQCEDIGTVKLPNWIRGYTKADVHFAFTSGTEFPEDLSKYSLIVHCGGCMLNEREMKYRMKCAEDQNVPMTNYGTAIAHIHGVLRRSIQVFSL